MYPARWLSHRSSSGFSASATRRINRSTIPIETLSLVVRAGPSASLPNRFVASTPSESDSKTLSTTYQDAGTSSNHEKSAFWDPRNLCQARAARAMSARWATNRISSTSASNDSVSALDGSSTSWLLPPPSCLEWTIRHLMA